MGRFFVQNKTRVSKPLITNILSGRVTTRPIVGIFSNLYLDYPERTSDNKNSKERESVIWYNKIVIGTSYSKYFSKETMLLVNNPRKREVYEDNLEQTQA